MSRSTLINFVDGYEAPDKHGGALSHTGKRFFVRSFSGAVTQRMKRYTSMKIVKLASAFSELIAYTSTKSYGASLLSFGLATLLISFLRDYLGVIDAYYTLSLIIGAVFAIVAVPLLLTDKPLSLLFQDNEITDYILFEFFAIKRMHKSSVGRSIPVGVSILVGVALAALGLLVPIFWVAIGIGLFAYSYVAMVSPEFSFFATFMLLPYVAYIPSPYGEAGFSFIVVLTAVSFLRKVLYGKRVVNVEQYDVLIGALLLTVMISGIFIKGVESFVGALLMLAMSLGYMLASNLLTNRRLTDCALNAIVISSLPAAIISIVRLLMAVSRANVKEALRNGISSGFESCGIAAVFFLVAIIFSVGLARQSHGAARGLYVSLATLDVFALLLTGEYFAIFAILIGLFAYLAVKAGGFYVLAVALLLLLPYSVLLLPDGVVGAIFDAIPSLSSEKDLLSVWQSSLDLLYDNLWFGIGIGENSFAAEMEGYGIVGADSAGNLLLELALEAGILAAVIFVLILLVRIRHRLTYRPYIKSSQVGGIASLSSVCVFALLAYGAFNYIWSDMIGFYIFWSVFGIGSATMRVAKRDNDEKLMYYVDTRKSTSSAINVEIKGKG